MFDGNPENDPALRDAAQEIGSRSGHVITLLGAEKKDAVTFYKLGTGSSVLPELTSFGREAVTLPMNTLDDDGCASRSAAAVPAEARCTGV